MSSNKKSYGIFPYRRKANIQEPGTPPGTAEHLGDQKIESIKLTLCEYDSSSVDFTPISKIDDAEAALKTPPITWLDIRGLHDIDKLQTIWSYYELHPLIREDIVNTRQRSKMEIYDNCIFFVLRIVKYSETDNSLHS